MYFLYKITALITFAVFVFEANLYYGILTLLLTLFAIEHRISELIERKR